MSSTESFCTVNSVSCVRGKYPSQLLAEWDTFHKNRGSENDRPGMVMMIVMMMIMMMMIDDDNDYYYDDFVLLVFGRCCQ